MMHYFVNKRTLRLKKKKDLDSIAIALLEYETLTNDDIKNVLNGKKLDKIDTLPKDSDKSDKDKPKSSVPTNPGRIKPGTQPTI